MEASELQGTIFDVVNMGRQHKMLHRFVEDTPLDGKHLQLDGRMLLSFGSCSYLGLETDERLKEGVRQAVTRYGTQFSSSRAYLSAPPYAELEERLSRIFDGYVLPVSTTTLGHLSAIPVLCQEKDAVLMDQMVHHSVQLAVTQARAQGTTVELVRHGDTAALERRLEQLSPLHRKVWVLLDGVYSMFGDLPDVTELQRLLGRFENLHLYVDDAHGMSIAGKHGRGMHLARMPAHPRMIVATSLNKAFASSGGCIVFQDEATRDRVRLCGGPYTFGGPVQPPMLGAALASAAIHLSPEITALQEKLAAGVKHFNAELLGRKLPLLEQNATPIFFVKCGPIKMSYALVQRLIKDGFYVTVATYPAVPLKRSGLRLSITAHHDQGDLTSLAQAIKHHYPLALQDVGLSRDEVEKLFSFHTGANERRRVGKLSRMFELSDVKASTLPSSAASLNAAQSTAKLQLEYTSTIRDLDPTEWNRLLGGRSTFTHATLSAFEAQFQKRPEPENNWGWHYFVVRSENKVVAATFFTDGEWKDDMLMRDEVSDRIDHLRANDPYFLTSRVMSMGSLLTEGNHLYLDREGPWQQALSLILEEASKHQRAVGATTLVVRDLPEGDAEVDAVLLEHGLVKMPMLDSWSADHIAEWKTDEEFLSMLRTRTRRNRTQKRVKAEVHDLQQHFTVKLWRKGIEPEPTAEDVKYWFTLYQQVKARKRRLNTFDLPADIFGRLWATPGWELMSIHLAKEVGGPADGRAVAVVANFIDGDRMVALICGLDGLPRGEISPYRQMLWQLMKRANAAGAKTLELGMDAQQEKMRLGCEPRKQCAYFQLTDHFSAELIGQVVQSVSLGEASAKSPATEAVAETAEDRDSERRDTDD